MLAQKTWGHVMRMISFLILLMMFVGSPSSADPISAAQDPSISAAGLGFSDPRIKRSPDWEIGVPNFSWIMNLGATEMPATSVNLETAAEEGDLKTVKNLIERGVDPNYYRGEALRLAAKHGHMEVVKYLLEAGAIPDANNGEALRVAAEHGHMEVVKYILEAGVNPDIDNGEALRSAAEHGRMELVKYLLEAGANPDGSNELYFKGTILEFAAMNNHLDIINVLLDAGATVEMEPYGVNILARAAENGSLEGIQRLLEAGADPDYREGYSLFIAAKRGHLDVVNAFLEAGVNTSANGGWAMDSAAKEGHAEVVKALIKGGGLTKDYGYSLFLAAKGGHLDVVNAFLEAGANASAYGGYAMDRAAGEGHLDVIKALIKGGARTKDYGSAMREAAFNGHLDIVKLMLEIGTDPNYGDVLKSAAEFGDLEVVRTLLEAGSNITYDDNIGSPLHSAASKGHSEVIALLVEYGADIKRPSTTERWMGRSKNIEDFVYGWTVMHEAAWWGQPMIEKLVALGADINVQDVKGQTPLLVAIQRKKVITAKEILRFCADLTLTDNEGKTALDLAKAVASENETDSSKFRDVVNILTEALPEKIASSPYNAETVNALREEFLTMTKANSTLKESRQYYIHRAIYYIFKERGRQGVTKIIEDHNCKMSLLEKGTVAMGKEYLARCECVPGQGPKMTFIPIQDGNLCGQRATVQETSASDAAVGLAVDSAAAGDSAAAVDTAAAGASAVAAAEAQI